MIYYRVAFQIEQTSLWRWRSTPVTSLNALQLLLRTYNAVPQHRIRIFFATSRENMDEMLLRENNGLTSASVTAKQLLEGKSLNALDVTRMELELSDAPDHDMPYVFTLPGSMKQMRAWLDLQSRVRSGELEP